MAVERIDEMTMRHTRLVPLRLMSRILEGIEAEALVKRRLGRSSVIEVDVMMVEERGDVYYCQLVRAFQLLNAQLWLSSILPEFYRAMKQAVT